MCAIRAEPMLWTSNYGIAVSIFTMEHEASIIRTASTRIDSAACWLYWKQDHVSDQVGRAERVKVAAYEATGTDARFRS